MDGFQSAFDGMLEINAPTYPIAVMQQRTVTNAVTVAVNSFIAGDDADQTLLNIISKAKLTNQVTEQLVRKYHKSFVELYDIAQQKIETLEKEIRRLRDPFQKSWQTIVFVPEAGVANPEIVEYIIQANLLGVPLKEVLPPHLLPSQ